MCNRQALQRDTDTPMPAPGAELTLAGLQYNFMMGDGTERWSDLCWTLLTRGGGWVHGIMGRGLRNNFPSGRPKIMSRGPVDHTKKMSRVE